MGVHTVPSGPGYFGTQERGDAASEFNALAFLVRSLLDGLHTITVCEVKSVTNSGGLSPAGFVDLHPLVKMVDGDNNAFDRAVIYRCPYQRIQGGANAIIMDPEPGDIGIAVFADRDISSAIANKGPANPGSARCFDLADAMYIGGVVNGTPTQYVQFSAAGIRIHSPTLVKIDAPDVQIVATTVEINATSVTVTAPTVAIAASASTTITTPLFTVNAAAIVHNGATLFNGPISQTPGTQGGTAATFDGPLTVTNDVTAAGKSVSTHQHHEHDGPLTGAPA